MSTVCLPSDLGIEHARAVHAQLSGHIEDAEVTLEMPEAARFHTATLQVLCAFVHTRAAAGRKTAWAPVPAPFAQAAARLGVESLLGLAPATSP